MTQLPELLTAMEVAAVLRVHPATVRRWMVDGTLPGIRVGRQIRFLRSDVEAMLATTAEVAS